MNKFMRIAIKEAKKGIERGDGGPFGAVIVKDGKVIAKGHNRVLSMKDPTRHGEIDAIRKACRKLGTFDLTGCELYTTYEPCHMCLCACMWANVNKIYYSGSIKDADKIGFRDDKFDSIFGGRDKLQDYMIRIDPECIQDLSNEYILSNPLNY